MTLDGYVDWATSHPILAFVEMIFGLYLLMNFIQIIVLIPGAINEYRDKRAAEQAKIQNEMRDTLKGPWG